jgi:hypothetical protein
MDIKKRGFAVGIIFLMLFSVNFVVAEWTEELNENLIAYYNFSQGFELTDIIDSKNNLSQVGIPINNATNGLIGNGWGGFSSSNYLKKDAPSELTLPNNTYFTINLWAKFDSVPSPASIRLAGIANIANKWDIYQLNTGLGVERIGCYFGGGGGSYLYDPNPINTHTWYMITLSHNSSGIFFYVNSALVAHSNSTNAITTDYGSDMFGISDPEPGTAFDGNIDELSLWANRTLTQSEITQLYNNGNGITYTDEFIPPAPTEWTEELNENLIAYWKLNNSPIDSTGNGYDGVEYSLDYAYGKIDYASLHEGCSNNMKINKSDFQFGDDEFTFKLWINSTYGNPIFLSTYNYEGGIETGWTYYKESSTGTSMFWNNGTYVVGDITIPNNQWHMLTMVANSTHFNLYVNGVYDKSVLRNSVTSINDISVGGVQIGGGNCMVGQEDEFGIWNRTLTNEEITQLYNNGNGITYTDEFIPPITPANQSGFWILNGTNLYTSNSSYKVGIGTSFPTMALEVIGNILVSNSISLGNNSLRLGTQDAYGRYQIWNFLPNSVLRLGSLGSDGDPQTVSSEGIVVYGKNAQGDTMSSPDFGYARIKPDRIGLYTSQDDIADYYFRVDANSLYLKNNSFTKTFEVTRETGLVNAKAGYSVNSQIGITNNTGFWMCKDATCSTTCQVDIKGGIIVGCN